jgi:hypothetical protein
MSGRSSRKHELPFLCQFDQFVKPSADDRYLRIPAIAVASDDKMYFRAGS